MKRFKKSILLVSMVVLCLSCDQDNITCLRVSGDIVTQKRKVDAFKGVFFNDVGNLHISQGNETEVLAKGQENVVNAFKAEVVEGELRLSLDRCFNGEDYQLDVFVTSPHFEEIEMAGTGSFQTQTEINVDNIRIIHSGVTRDFDVNIKADTLETLLVGSGNIKYTGYVNYHNILLSGVGDIEAYSMPSKATEITINGKGDIYTEVSEHLSVALNAAGNVYYKGTPEIEQTGNGNGEVINDN